MDILGVAYPGHDTGAALLRDGILIAAVEEERLNRQKHTTAMPLSAIDYCCHAAGLDLARLPTLTIPYRLSFSRDLGRMAGHFLTHLPGTLRSPAGRGGNFLRDLLDMRKLKSTLRRRGFKGSYVHVDHHTAHAAAAFFTSPYDEAAILSLDGMGEWTTALLARGRGNRISELQRLYFPHSLGYFYAGMTEYLGFRANSDEGTVMAMAAYGDYRQVAGETGIDDFIIRHPRGIRINPSFFSFHYGGREYFSRRCRAVFGPPRAPDGKITARHFHLAALAQEVTRRALQHLLEILYHRTGLTRVCVTGGVALNSVINGQIRRMSGFTDSYIFPSPHDAGLAAGGPLFHWYCTLDRSRRAHPYSPFTGPVSTDAEIDDCLGRTEGIVVKSGDVVARLGRALARGEIAALYRGRLEFGPRALGHRSILADPRSAAMRDRVNRLKGRLWFRPLAAAVAVAAAADYFVMPEDSPFMQKVFPVRPEKAGCIPALVHHDGSCRLQTVAAGSFLGRVIARFAAGGGVPVLINTSLNGPGQAIVSTFAEALALFLRSDLDILATENRVIRKVDRRGE